MNGPNKKITEIILRDLGKKDFRRCRNLKKQQCSALYKYGVFLSTWGRGEISKELHVFALGEAQPEIKKSGPQVPFSFINLRVLWDFLNLRMCYSPQN